MQSAPAYSANPYSWRQVGSLYISVEMKMDGTLSNAQLKHYFALDTDV